MINKGDNIEEMAQKVFILAMALAILICTLVGMTSAVTDGKVVKLTNDSTGDSFSAWSPDGAKIVFTSNRAGISDVWVMDSDGSNQVQLTEIGVSDNPKWSPDGTKIAFISDRSGNLDVWVMDSDGSNKVQLTTDVIFVGGPASWSPDGKRIAYSALFDGDDTLDIWVMNSDGSEKVQLTTGKGGERPLWSPDGKKIAYTLDGNIYVITLEEETTPTTTATPVTPSPTEKIPGFEAIIAISALLVVAYIVRLEIVW